MIYAFVRKTLDWSDEALFWRQLPEPMRPAVELWNATFRLPFHLFRREVKAIAEGNWASLPGVTFLPLEEIPERELVLPTDDDDWFSPRVGPTLEGARSAGVFGYRWPIHHLEVPLSLRHQFGSWRRRMLPRTPPRYATCCGTNGYATTMGRLEKKLLESHVSASFWFMGNPTLVRVLEHPLAIANRTLASCTQFVRRGHFDRARLLEKHRRYQLLYEAPLPPELSWAKPHVAKMRDLMASLEPTALASPDPRLRARSL
jgi:hypothetical protein